MHTPSRWQSWSLLTERWACATAVTVCSPAIKGGKNDAGAVWPNINVFISEKWLTGLVEMPLGQTLSSPWTNDSHVCVISSCCDSEGLGQGVVWKHTNLFFWVAGEGVFLRLKSIPDQRGKVPTACDGQWGEKQKPKQMIIYNIVCVNYCKFMPPRRLKKVQTVKINSLFWVTAKGVLGGTWHNHANTLCCWHSCPLKTFLMEQLLLWSTRAPSSCQEPAGCCRLLPRRAAACCFWNEARAFSCSLSAPLLFYS